MSEPFEIIAGPYTVYLAAVGEAFPNVDAVPAGNWFKLGTNGAKNYGEDGVSVDMPQTIEEHYGLGSTGPIKAYRTREGLKVTFTLHDLSLEQFRKALNNQAVSTVNAASGVPGSKSIPLRRGSDVELYTCLVRGDVSPEGDDFKSQFQIPKGYVSGSPKLVFVKGQPAGLAFEFTALEDLDAAAGEEFGKLVVQNADAL